MRYDIIPDIHGQIEKLTKLLHSLGYRKIGKKWTAPDSDRSIIFLGDFIDRGLGQREVITLVRELEGCGVAERVMANHELNALHYHIKVDGVPLRKNSAENKHQHYAFLKAFSDTKEREEALAFLAKAPFFLRKGNFVFVHAFWNSFLAHDLTNALGQDARLPDFHSLGQCQAFIDAAHGTSVAGRALESMVKGPESKLPEGFSFFTGDGIERFSARRAWWVKNPANWYESCISLPDDAILPEETPPEIALAGIDAQTSLVFGHYWMRDWQEHEGIKILGGQHVCLDQSAGHGGGAPLVSLLLDDEKELPKKDGWIDPKAITIAI